MITENELYDYKYNPEKVNSSVSGKQTIPTKEVQKRLGRTAFDVLVFLFHRREKNGKIKKFFDNNERLSSLLNESKNEKIQKRISDGAEKGVNPYSKRSIEEAMKKLRKAGLVETSKEELYKKKVSYTNGKIVKISVKRRRVFGDFRNGVFYIPHNSYLKIMSRNTHGGSRNSGKTLTKKTNLKKDKAISRVPLGDFKSAFAEPPNTTETASKNNNLEPISRNMEIVSRVPSIYKSNRSLYLKIKRQCKKNASQTLTNLTNQREELMEDNVNEDKVERTPEQIASYAIEKLPIKLRPCTSDFNLPQLPSMKTLDEFSSVKDKVLFMISAYNSTIEKVFEKKSRVFGRGDITKSKHYKQLSEASEFMEEEGIPPHAWVSFCIDFYNFYLKQNKVVDKQGNETFEIKDVPPISFVYKKAIMKKRLGYFSSKLSSYRPSTVHKPKSFHKLVTAYYQIPAEVIKRLDEEQPKNYQDVDNLILEVTKKFLPNGLERLREDITNDGCLWLSLQESLRQQGTNIWAVSAKARGE